MKVLSVLWIPLVQMGGFSECITLFGLIFVSSFYLGIKILFVKISRFDE